MLISWHELMVGSTYNATAWTSCWWRCCRCVRVCETVWTEFCRLLCSVRHCYLSSAAFHLSPFHLLLPFSLSSLFQFWPGSIPILLLMAWHGTHSTRVDVHLNEMAAKTPCKCFEQINEKWHKRKFVLQKQSAAKPSSKEGEREGHGFKQQMNSNAFWLHERRIFSI